MRPSGPIWMRRGRAALRQVEDLAERAAWDFIAREGGGLELSVINPAAIFGPCGGPHFSGSIRDRQIAARQRHAGGAAVYFGVVDVRDVADLHLRAMTAPAAKGERFIAISGETLSILDIAKILRRGTGSQSAQGSAVPGSGLAGAARREPISLRQAVVPMLGGGGIPPAPRRDRCSGQSRVSRD